MNVITIYACTVCGRTSRDKTEIERCEKSHHGLTAALYKEYQQLIKEMQRAIAMVQHTANGHTRAAEEVAISAVLEFEKQHFLDLQEV